MAARRKPSTKVQHVKVQAHPLAMKKANELARKGNRRVEVQDDGSVYVLNAPEGSPYAR